MYACINWTNRFTTPCEETPWNNPEGGKKKPKKNEEERREPLTDVNYLPKIPFQNTFCYFQRTSVDL